MGNWKTTAAAALLTAALASISARAQESFVPDAPVEITVFANRVNIRSMPGDEGEIITQANYGDKLRAVEFTPEWVRILPPDGVTFWVHKPMLTGDEVNANLLNVRAGAGVEHNIVGKLARGDKVERIGEKGDWIQIKPAGRLSVWISRSLVKLPASAVPPRPAPAPVPAPAPTPAPATPPPPPKPMPPAPPEPQPIPAAPEPPPVQPVQETEPPRRAPAPPSDLNLVPLAGQGTPASRIGKLSHYLLRGDAPSRYYLTVSNGGKEETVCYVTDSGGNLKPWSGRRVIVRGWDFWVQGKTLPVMVPESIEAARADR
jgi:SH3-like domain-containing protein